MSIYYSPLRYPGGKSRLADYVKLILKDNNLLGCDYIEPYAGGASVALELLFEEFASQIHINDLSLPIYSFWYSVLNYTEDLCRLIMDTDITIEVWKTQKIILKNEPDDLLKLGFATFFLNRTNRSGILKAGAIGGKHQSGKWKLDARFNKENLIDRIQKIGRFRSRISLYNQDAEILLSGIEKICPDSKLFTYLDPPYYVKGQGLYDNFYEHEDHKSVAKTVDKLNYPWIVSYDYHPSIKKFYKKHPYIIYKLGYSVQKKYKGSEIFFFSDQLNVPDIETPLHVPADRILSFPNS
ncbi:MAG: DNA methyltransferase [Balneola sp.]|jgi:DNA adenine methylase|nr:DNA methyltransferase [Balneola sp.]MBE77648.1 DNA methyltransferase [Balneola sp.]|tara:strand:+ start:99 stop:986 length:888 start_codon:yes stop_codon:yes gene_type:complete